MLRFEDGLLAEILRDYDREGRGAIDYHAFSQMVLGSTTGAGEGPSLCDVRREGGCSLVIGGPSLVMLEGKEGAPL